jgi:parvulin-like peptidyl-prolyl isomerase
LTTIILIILILAGLVSFLTIGFNVTNSTAVRNGNDGNTTTSNKQLSSDLEEDKLGEIASVPKCLGSALCPD